MKMKICTVCGSITEDTESCEYCGNKDLRTVTSLKISMGKFEGRYEYSEEEIKFLNMLRGTNVIKEDYDNKES